MPLRQVGVVKQLFRYPVKSMLGEEAAELEIDPDGVVGDRAWALRETNGRIASAKKYVDLFGFRAAYDEIPAADRLSAITITLPDGRQVRTAEGDPSAAISAVVRRPVKLER
jgi:uncharacterized protein YcbX